MDELERRLLEAAKNFPGTDPDDDMSPEARMFYAAKRDFARAELNRILPGWKEELLARRRTFKEAKEHYLELKLRVSDALGEGAVSDIVKET